MKKIQVIKRSNLPAKPPYALTTIAYLLMDKFQASGMVQGAVWTLIILLWIAVIYSMFTCDEVDLFENKK
jgi:hypothetical protein